MNAARSNAELIEHAIERGEIAPAPHHTPSLERIVSKVRRRHYRKLWTRRQRQSTKVYRRNCACYKPIDSRMIGYYTRV